MGEEPVVEQCRSFKEIGRAPMTRTDFKVLAAPILSGIRRHNCAIMDDRQYPAWLAVYIEHVLSTQDLVCALKALVQYYRRNRDD